MKLRNFMRGSIARGSATAREQGRIEKLPGGSADSAKTSPIRIALTGVRLAGFNTNGHPAAMAGAILWATRLSGKLKGEIRAQGPIGTRWTIPR